MLVCIFLSLRTFSQQSGFLGCNMMMLYAGASVGTRMERADEESAEMQSEEIP